jgi:hypothetical protein
MFFLYICLRRLHACHDRRELLHDVPVHSGVTALPLRIRRPAPTSTAQLANKAKITLLPARFIENPPHLATFPDQPRAPVGSFAE